MKEILIDVGVFEDRVALTEEGLLAELYIERNQENRILGNIYKGRVVNILPGMQAAFIDIGLEKNAFLYVKDTYPHFNKDMAIEDALKIGQDILVQIIKEPYGSKGARVSMNLAIPGRYVVLMPFTDHIGISRRIALEKEKERLKHISEDIKPHNMGIIIRTVAENKSEDEIKDDIRYLTKIYYGIDKAKNSGYSPKLLYKDVELIHRVIRDLLDDSVDHILINNKDKYESIYKFMEITMPEQQNKLKLIDSDKELFVKHSLESQILKALERIVWLENGGYIVIDETEALTVIDINTGKFIGETTLRDTVYRTNIEATREIARQLRLRNIGGIIIIDFIDMFDDEEKNNVIETLQKELEKDRIKTHILGFTQLGLLEMTRKNSRNRISSNLQAFCNYCQGNAKLCSAYSVLTKIEKDILRYKNNTNVECVEIAASYHVYMELQNEKKSLEKLEKSSGIGLKLELNQSLEANDYKLKILKFSGEILDK